MPVLRPAMTILMKIRENPRDPRKRRFRPPPRISISPALAKPAQPYTIPDAMPFADLELSRRLERAEGKACLRYAEARRRLHPESGAEWIECAGAYAVFDGIDSPVTQSFGLGIFEEPSPLPSSASSASSSIAEPQYISR